MRSAPRTWGSSRRDGRHGDVNQVRPTHVGIIPPHPAIVVAARVRPTHVGIIPAPRPTWACSASPPRARGDHPRPSSCSGISNGSAPRTWGSSPRLVASPFRSSVRPTHVGIIPTIGSGAWATPSPPHARGDHPCIRRMSVRQGASAPRTWGSSLHKAYERAGRVRSAPRTWGSSRHFLLHVAVRPVRPTHVGIIPSPHTPERRLGVRPTHVGIIPTDTQPGRGRGGPPHARGDHPSMRP